MLVVHLRHDDDGGYGKDDGQIAADVLPVRLLVLFRSDELLQCHIASSAEAPESDERIESDHIEGDEHGADVAFIEVADVHA